MDLLVLHMYPWFMKLSIVTLPQIRLQAKVLPIHSTAVDALLDCGKLEDIYIPIPKIRYTDLFFLSAFRESASCPCVQACSSYCFLVLMHQYGMFVFPLFSVGVTFCTLLPFCQSLCLQVFSEGIFCNFRSP